MPTALGKMFSSYFSIGRLKSITQLRTNFKNEEDDTGKD